MIKLARVFKRTSAKTGKVYWGGRLGGANVLLFEGEPADDGTPTMDIMLADREQQKPQQQDQPNGQRDYAAPYGSGDRS